MKEILDMIQLLSPVGFFAAAFLYVTTESELKGESRKSEWLSKFPTGDIGTFVRDDRMSKAEVRSCERSLTGYAIAMLLFGLMFVGSSMGG